MIQTLFIGGIGMQEVLLIALVVLLFFGGKKIPELMKGLGKGVRSFKDGMNEVEKDIKDTTANDKEQQDGKQ
ncbi:MAG: twin-arginine translocase TatA/TatE family subunit [Bacteroidales bacterium]|nr:twin-arginine translocase TatA/TatE family subunit [Bacteroidales bacterium]MDY2692770.1 twin-arginine translocase TatA/TatE family subunit [Prevotella sp.]MDD5787412.1 twin-arginine translocase TatA/TatE family subunit [Bacteroidales bacterium]MDD6897605.1 twin-arginine translocase TatA/TatE family subunit [Bacteroidales bacterium]MDY4731735.1 twin-arginine translocase TatA/TatE family subunit [Prevotella sp.]